MARVRLAIPLAQPLPPPGGLYEDPATGAAAAAFGGYLRALSLVSPPARITIEQGLEMGRPSNDHDRHPARKRKRHPEQRNGCRDPVNASARAPSPRPFRSHQR
ncbi:PhzF family phenazine biosynthesis protein [Streptomyces canus]|uniref:PhzF family phenazine biosynthesis protein n=1 Tax=Streptomyces canus TaxID=58343 RepID=UPI0038656C0C